MDGFVTSHLAADGVGRPVHDGLLHEADIPFHWALANAFTVCDGYHCSMLGPTWPNRLYLMTGTVDPRGGHGGPVIANEVPPSGLSWTTYPEMLTDAGVAWKVYQEIDNYGMNVLEHFAQYRDAPTSSPLYQRAMRRYRRGAVRARRGPRPAPDRLVDPAHLLPVGAPGPSAGGRRRLHRQQDQRHRAEPDVWASTVFFLVYDENDGFFDHVAPPTAPPGTADEHITVDGASQPIGLGFRVPCVVVSPWTVGGHVAHDTFDHTSVLRFLERLTGVRNPNISAWRRRTVGDFAGVLGCRPAGRSPRLPSTAADLVLAEREVREFQLPPIPGASQTFPVQPRGTKPVQVSPPAAKRRRCERREAPEPHHHCLPRRGMLACGGRRRVGRLLSGPAGSAPRARSPRPPATARRAPPTSLSPGYQAFGAVNTATARSSRPTTSTTRRCPATPAITTTTGPIRALP